MIQIKLDESVLKPSTIKLLRNKQRAHDANLPWEEQVKLAKKKWDKKPKKAFVDVREKLLTVQHYCCYCEHNVSDDEIEHIFTKSLFPELTFFFNNFVLVCGRCNRRKLNAFAVFDDETSTAITKYEKGKPHSQPKSLRNVFIDPRSENPMDYFLLNLNTGILEIHPLADERYRLKAEYTRELLELNHPSVHSNKRKGAVNQFKNILNDYIGCRDAETLGQLVKHLPNHQIPPPKNLSLSELKENGKVFFLQEIKELHFQTVWLEMKRQYLLNPTDFAELHPEIAKVLQMVPELL
jgi:uncharacterized protein (TIGR02646 family)